MTPSPPCCAPRLWARALAAGRASRASRRTIVERASPAGRYVCRKGEPVEHWIGVVDGLVKMANVSPDGKPTTLRRRSGRRLVRRRARC